MVSAFLCGLGLTLFGCATEPPPSQPSFYQSMAQAGAQVDPQAAASMISGYRRNNMLGEVTLDPQLMRMAEEQARAQIKDSTVRFAVGIEHVDDLIADIDQALRKVLG